MNTDLQTKKYDLEERTILFASHVRNLIKSIPKNTVESSDRDQLARSSGSVAANYIEANEAISGKDFSMRIRICRKEAKESMLWLKLLKNQTNPELHGEIDKLADESLQLVKIFNSIVHKLKIY